MHQIQRSLGRALAADCVALLMSARFRAVLRSAFEMRGQGETVLTVEIISGTVKVGDSLSVPTASGVRTAQVRAIGAIDYDVRKPTFRAEVALFIGDVSGAEVVVGAEVYSGCIEPDAP